MFAVVILAAGEGKRMKSHLPKVLHPLCGKPMLHYVLRAVEELSPKRTVLVVGHGLEKVKEAFPLSWVEYAIQEEQLGTAHAVLAAKEAIFGSNGLVLILNGDSPLIRVETLRRFINTHKELEAGVSILTAFLEDPGGYGRVVRDEKGGILKVIEEKDANLEEKNIKEINTGVYLVESNFLWSALERIDRKNKQGEYYLPDIVEVAGVSDKKVLGFRVDDPEEVLGVNSRVELAKAEKILRKRTDEELMLSGVTIIDPDTTYISSGVSIGVDTVIYPNTFIYGDTKIGKGCRIGPSVLIEDSSIGDEVTIRFSSYITESKIEDRVTIGPFAHLRPGAHIASEAKVGNFVEIKKSRIGQGSKVLHLSYIGDAQVGEDVNIGAGTITCNYDGAKKHETVIEDGAFIGSDTMLVAPVKVGKGATTGAGSTITKDVPSGALAVERSTQVTVTNWKRKSKKEKK